MSDAVERLRVTAEMHSDFLHVPVAVRDIEEAVALHDEAVRVMKDVKRMMYDRDLEERNPYELEAVEAFLAKVGGK